MSFNFSCLCHLDLKISWSVSQNLNFSSLGHLDLEISWIPFYPILDVCMCVCMYVCLYEQKEKSAKAETRKEQDHLQNPDKRRSSVCVGVCVRRCVYVCVYEQKEKKAPRQKHAKNRTTFKTRTSAEVVSCHGSCQLSRSFRYGDFVITVLSDVLY
jgi:hypothetical protein